MAVMWLCRRQDRERQSQELKAKEEALVSLADDGRVCVVCVVTVVLL